MEHPERYRLDREILFNSNAHTAGEGKINKNQITNSYK